MHFKFTCFVTPKRYLLPTDFNLLIDGICILWGQTGRSMGGEFNKKYNFYTFCPIFVQYTVSFRNKVKWTIKGDQISSQNIITQQASGKTFNLHAYIIRDVCKFIIYVQNWTKHPVKRHWLRFYCRTSFCTHIHNHCLEFYFSLVLSLLLFVIFLKNIFVGKKNTHRLGDVVNIKIKV